MKKFINLEGRQQCCDTELPVTHVLVGKRDMEWNAPPQKVRDRIAKNVNDSTQEERVIYAAWVHAVNHQGKYALSALVWSESRDEAEAMKSKFPEPEWEQDSLYVMEVEN